MSAPYIYGWATARTLSDAQREQTRLGRERPDLAFAIVSVTSPTIRERERIRAERAGAQYIVGVFERTDYERARIPGLNA